MEYPVYCLRINMPVNSFVFERGVKMKQRRTSDIDVITNGS